MEHHNQLHAGEQLQNMVETSLRGDEMSPIVQEQPEVQTTVQEPISSTARKHTLNWPLYRINNPKKGQYKGKVRSAIVYLKHVLIIL